MIGKGHPRLTDYPRTWLANALDFMGGQFRAMAYRVRPPIRTTAHWIHAASTDTPNRDAVERDLASIVVPQPGLRSLIDEYLAR